MRCQRERDRQPYDWKVNRKALTGSAETSLVTEEPDGDVQDDCMDDDSSRKRTETDYKRHQKSDVSSLRHVGELTLRPVESSITGPGWPELALWIASIAKVRICVYRKLDSNLVWPH